MFTPTNMVISSKEQLKHVDAIKRMLVSDANKKEFTKKEVLFAKCFIGIGLNEKYVLKIINQMKSLGMVKEHTECYEWVGDWVITERGWV